MPQCGEALAVLRQPCNSWVNPSARGQQNWSVQSQRYGRRVVYNTTRQRGTAVPGRGCIRQAAAACVQPQPAAGGSAAWFGSVLVTRLASRADAVTSCAAAACPGSPRSAATRAQSLPAWRRPPPCRQRVEGSGNGAQRRLKAQVPWTQPPRWRLLVGFRVDSSTRGSGAETTRCAFVRAQGCLLSSS